MTENERAERVFQAVVYAFEGRDVPADLLTHGMVKRGLKFRAQEDLAAQVSKRRADAAEELRADADKARIAMADAAEMLWVVLANVSGGDWTKQSPEWQEAAAHWRDNYFRCLRQTQTPASATNAVDPSAQHTGTPSPRDKASS